EQTALERDLRTFYDENKAGMHIRGKKQLLRMQESIESINLRIYHNLVEKIAKKDDILHLDIYKEEGLKKINEAMGKIAADIKIITKNLISLESRGAIAKTSPIDDEYLLEIDKRKNELRQVIGCSASLDNEYDRFAAEMELTKGRV
ncbi:MAG: hypothetical protein LBQ38_00575, partial [Spirochaetaceae bacterium]|nr:hypothetical protein [Spirochaetaceae bacterium]